MSLPNLPTAKFEYSDGSNWYQLATEAYVQNALANLNEIPCYAATTTTLDATYANGTSGVGATLTSSSPAAFSLDGVNPSQGARILVKDQTDPKQNGIYTLTTVGSVSTAWVLTRSTDYDTPAQMVPGEIIGVGTGINNKATLWMLTSTITAVGISSVTFAAVNANNPVFTGTSGVLLPGGTAAQRPTATTQNAGTLRYWNGL